MALIVKVVWEKKMLENGGRKDDDGRTPEQGYTKSTTCEPDGSGELIIGGRDPLKLIERTKQADMTYPETTGTETTR